MAWRPAQVSQRAKALDSQVGYFHHLHPPKRKSAAKKIIQWRIIGCLKFGKI